jgi:DNA-binding HxlR family transcriptional regulator
MPATVRYDEQYCPIARALDVLGDRWTLLILRELVNGDQRFTDLRTSLPGIAPTVLTQRLRALTDQGLVTTKELPPPAARSVYTLTERGRSTGPVLSALARWGMPLLEPPSEARRLRPERAVNIAVAIYYDAVAAEGVDARYLLRADGREVTLSSVNGGGEAHREPDLVIDGSGAVWIEIRQGLTTLAEARRQRRLKVSGSKAALANFQRIFRVP